MLPATPQPVRELIESFSAARRALTEGVFSGTDSLQLAQDLSALTDEFILSLWEASAPDFARDHCALLAIGSYGRGELAVHSDIDLMVEVGEEALLERPEFHQAMERFITWCRDAKLQLGHAVRTPEQTRREFKLDPRTPISLIDARLLPGQPKARGDISWEPARAEAALKFLRDQDEGLGFVHTLMRGYRERSKRNGKTIYLLEPDIKSGEGGLRDLNCIHWAARVRWGFSPGEERNEEVGWSAEFRQDYRRCLGWILALRNMLHLTHGRKNDRLAFPDQENIAAVLLKRSRRDAGEWALAADPLDPDDTPTSDRAGRAERLMRLHYRQARKISMMAQRFLRRWHLQEGNSELPVGELFGLSAGQLGFHSRYFQRSAQPDASLKDPPNTPELMPDGPARQLTPDEVFDALEYAAEHQALLGPVLELQLTESVEKWGPAQRQDRALCRRLFELLTDPHTSPRTSRRLLENGILTRLIPEFEPLVCHVQHDVYHVYTTDIHSLKCLEKARKLVAGTEDLEAERWGLFRRIGAEIQRTEVFLLAALFHDIGKNRGGDHSRRGAEMMEDVGRRLGLSSGDINRLAFLVREHLTLSDTARRRDLSDPRVIRELAGRLRTVEALNELCALTFCDMATVGPNVMTDWNAALIAELYQRLRQAIESGLESLWRDHETLVEAQRETLLKMALSAGADPQKNDPAQHGARRYVNPAGQGRAGIEAESAGRLRSQLDAFVRDVPADHFATADPEALLRQFQTYRRATKSSGTEVSFMALPERGVTELIICTRDVPGTLAKIAGVISASGLNIMAAQIVTTASGRTLDIFQVSQGAPLALLMPQRELQAPADPKRLEQLAQTLVETLQSGESVELLLKRRLAQARLEPRPTPPVRTLVDARQDISDAFTVFEVRAADRVGLLYEIARALWEHGVSTHVSKIDSLGNEIIDTFYVESAAGGKLDEAQLARVANALYRTLAESPYLDQPAGDR